MTTSGPSVAKTSSTQTSQPSCQSCDRVCGSPVSAIPTQESDSTRALIRDGEYRCISGVIRTE